MTRHCVRWTATLVLTLGFAACGDDGPEPEITIAKASPSGDVQTGPAGYLVGGELAQLLGDDELEGQVKQQVADFSADLSGLSFAECVVQLQHFLDQVRAKRFPGLRPIPGTPIPQVAHHRHRASKR